MTGPTAFVLEQLSALPCQPRGALSRPKGNGVLAARGRAKGTRRVCRERYQRQDRGFRGHHRRGGARGSHGFGPPSPFVGQAVRGVGSGMQLGRCTKRSGAWLCPHRCRDHPDARTRRRPDRPGAHTGRPSRRPGARTRPWRSSWWPAASTGRDPRPGAQAGRPGRLAPPSPSVTR
jgi:hypothetical protein